MTKNIWIKDREIRRIVVKLGTNLLTLNGDKVDKAFVEKIASQVVNVRSYGIQVILVSSGAVAAGLASLKCTPNPDALRTRGVVRKQAIAALGQPALMDVYRDTFGLKGLQCGQVLISRDDLNMRAGYLNVRETLRALLDIGAIPIVNENDPVAVHELEGEVYGDNDRLSAMTANLIDADLLLLLGTVDGLHKADPNIVPDAPLIPLVEQITPYIERIARGPHNGYGSGGMASKMDAVRLASASGIGLIIASGLEPNVIVRICEGEMIGTAFPPASKSAKARKRWMITGTIERHGNIEVDRGAARALIERGISLLPIGVSVVSGNFKRGDIVQISSPDGEEIAYGIANYSAEDARIIKGSASSLIQNMLGKSYGEELIHRNNMVLVYPRETKSRTKN